MWSFKCTQPFSRTDEPLSPLSDTWNIFEKQDHTTLCSPPPSGLLGLPGNAMQVVLLLSPMLDQSAFCIHSININGLATFLTDKTKERVCMCFHVNSEVYEHQDVLTSTERWF